MNKYSKFILFISICVTHISFTSSSLSSQGIKLVAPKIRSSAIKTSSALTTKTFGSNSSNIQNLPQQDTPLLTAPKPQLPQDFTTRGWSSVEGMPVPANPTILKSFPSEQYQQAINKMTTKQVDNLFQRAIEDKDYRAIQLLAGSYKLSTNLLNNEMLKAIKNNNNDIADMLIENHHFKAGTDIEELVLTTALKANNKTIEQKIIHEHRYNYSIDNILSNILEGSITTDDAHLMNKTLELLNSSTTFNSNKIIENGFQHAAQKNDEYAMRVIAGKMNGTDAQKAFSKALEGNNQAAMDALWGSQKLNSSFIREQYKNAEQSENEELLRRLRKTTKLNDSEFTESRFERALKTAAKVTAALTLIPDSGKDLLWDAGTTAAKKVREEGKSMLSRSLEFKVGGQGYTDNIDAMVYGQPISSKSTTEELPQKQLQYLEHTSNQREHFVPEDRNVIEHENFGL